MSTTIEEIDLTIDEEIYKTSSLNKRHNGPNEQLIKCHICQKSFKKNYNYKKHLEKIHPTVMNDIQHTKSNLPTNEINKLTICNDILVVKEKLYQCTKCDKKFSLQTMLEKHMQMHVLKKNLCPHCKLEFIDLTLLQRHILTHQEAIKKFTCEVCDLKFLNEKDTKNHVCLYCIKCNRNFSYEAAMERHQQLHLKKEANFTCSFCPKKFFQKTNVVQHEYIHTRPTHTCQICKKQFNKVYHLKAHVKLHSKKHLYSCDKCGKSFKSKLLLEKHISWHLNVRKFKCVDCDMLFENSRNLMKHKQIKLFHVKKYNCDYCDKLCCTKKAWDTHMQKHIIFNLYYMCTECDETFADENYFKEHSKEHTCIKFYKCSVCTKEFLVKDDFIQHIFGHKRTFPCDGCETNFDSREKLLKHKSTDDGVQLNCAICKATFKCTVGLKKHLCYPLYKQNKKLDQMKFGNNYDDNYAAEHLPGMKKTYTPKTRINHKDHTYALQSWPIKPYRCKKCGKHFCRLVNLEKHIQEIHPFYLSAESSENSDDVHEDYFIMPKIETVTSLRVPREKIFVSDENVQHLSIDFDIQECGNIENNSEDEDSMDPLYIGEENDSEVEETQDGSQEMHQMQESQLDIINNIKLER